MQDGRPFPVGVSPEHLWVRPLGAIQDVLNRELQAIWLTGKDIAEALGDAEADIQDLLDG